MRRRSRPRRTWSIRARTALAFAAAAMALAAGVVVFTNLMSIAGAGHAVAALEFTSADDLDPGAGATGSITSSGPGVSAGIAGAPEPDGFPDGTFSDRPGADLAAVQVIAVLQWQWSAVGVAGAGLVAGGVGWLVSRRMLRPIDRITATANRITASNLHERIDLDGPDDELRRLSRTVDDLLDRLHTAFESQRRFVAQASHELRTPLAVQRAALQIGLPDDAEPDDVRATRDELLEQNRRTEHIVESLLTLAEADRGIAGHAAAVDLAELADEVVASVSDFAARVGVAVVHEAIASDGAPDPLGDETLVRQLITNLVRNAVEYNEPDGFVRVTTDATGLVVENSGPVVSDDVVPLLVEPFRRCPRSTETGRHSGLGLSIVASIAQTHGWRLELTARPGGGLRVGVSLM